MTEDCRCGHQRGSHYDNTDEGGTSCQMQFCECAAFIPTAVVPPPDKEHKRWRREMRSGSRCNQH